MSAERDTATTRPVALLVHPASVTYVRSVVDFVGAQLALHAGRELFYAETPRVDDVDVPPRSAVFVVGDGFPRFARRPDCRYVLVNFSLVRRLRWWRPIPRSAARWIAGKRRDLLGKRDLYDVVLDFHPRQTALLARELATAAVAVRGFVTGVGRHDRVRLS